MGSVLSNMKLGRKLVSGFIVVALIGAIIGIVGYTSLGTMTSHVNEIGENRLPAVQSLLIMSEVQSAVLTGERGLINEKMARDPSIQQAQHEWIESAWKRAEDAYKAYESLPKTEAEAASWKDFVPEWEEFKQLDETVRSLARQRDQALASGSGASAIQDQLFETSLEARKSFLKSNETLSNIVKENMDAAKTANEAAEKAAATSKTIMVIAVLIGFAASVGLGLWLSGMITKPMSRISEAAEKIAVGDVEQNIDYKSGDEVGALANSFRALIDYIRGVANAADAVSKGDLSAKVEARSERDVLSKSFIRAIASLQDMSEETKTLIKAAQDGDLSKRGNVARFQGGYAELIGGINQMMDAVVQPINEAASVLEKVADRDLSIRMKGDYRGDYARIKDSLNTAVDNLDQGLAQVAVAAEQVASASGQISSGSQALAQGASEQASALEEISSSLAEMLSMTKQNTANAKEARGMADDARGGADRGVESMRKLSSAIDKIKASSDETAKIVKTIDEIAFQTNLLALNAAVEAARAGDAGKGFAVVAEEVRNLAMRSAEAAKDTANMIEEAVKNAEDGVAMNQEVLKNLEEINSQVNRVSEVMAEIAAASDQQSQGIDQVNTAVGQMDTVTQQNAANSEESASAAEELSSQAEEMRSLVGGFKLSQATSSIPQAPRVANTPAPPAKKKQERELVATGKKNGHGSKADDPAKVIPFDDMDTLQEF